MILTKQKIIFFATGINVMLTIDKSKIARIECKIIFTTYL